ncbi:hypothetical protein HDV57DRAFT_29362 [Trichoderma longibrachiatum]
MRCAFVLAQVAINNICLRLLLFLAVMTLLLEPLDPYHHLTLSHRMLTFSPKVQSAIICGRHITPVARPISTPSTRTAVPTVARAVCCWATLAADC